MGVSREQGVHAIWTIEKDETGTVAYVEGFSTATNPTARADGEPTFGWFCFEAEDDFVDYRAELRKLGFTDEQIAQAEGDAEEFRLDGPQRFAEAEAVAAKFFRRPKDRRRNSKLRLPRVRGTKLRRNR